MSEKAKVNIPDRKKTSTVTVHKTSFPTMSIELDGANYHVWSQIMEMHIVGRRNSKIFFGH